MLFPLLSENSEDKTPHENGSIASNDWSGCQVVVCTATTGVAALCRLKVDRIEMFRVRISASCEVMKTMVKLGCCFIWASMVQLVSRSRSGVGVGCKVQRHVACCRAAGVGEKLQTNGQPLSAPPVRVHCQALT